MHDALDNFWWLARELTACPTCIVELFQLTPIAKGHHDSSGTGCGGICFPAPTASICKGFTQHPILWHLRWSQHISDFLESNKNPHRTISNLDLELAGNLLHLDCAAQCLDDQEHTILSNGNSLATTFWERNAITNSPPAYLRQLKSAFTEFVWENYLSKSNPINA